MEEEDVGWNNMQSYYYISDDKVAGTQVGDLIAETIILVKEAMDHTKMFRTPLTSIFDELTCLKLQLDKMGEDADLMEAINNELKGIYFLDADCNALVRKCSRIYSWQFNDKPKASNELLQFSSRIVRCCIDLEYTSARWGRRLVIPQDEVVTGDVVGGLLGQTATLMEETTSTNILFSSNIRTILNYNMNPLHKKFDKNGKDNDQMNLPNEELRPIYDFLRRQCKIVMFRCMKFPIYSSYIEKGRYWKDLKKIGKELTSFCNTIDLSYTIDSKPIKDEIVESAAGEYGMNKLCLDEQVTAISYEYDVFLSFRGDDTRESFTSTLFYALSKVYKVKTFMDVIFKKGSKLEELLKMVEKSRMSIVVFSENFAESEWCLNELAKIFEESDRRGHEVLPVFYKINPSELRQQDSGKIKVHMEKHHNKYGKDSYTIKRWSNAIKELGNSSGYTYRSGRGKQEIELAEEIAQEILNRLHG